MTAAELRRDGIQERTYANATHIQSHTGTRSTPKPLLAVPIVRLRASAQTVNRDSVALAKSRCKKSLALKERICPRRASHLRSVRLWWGVAVVLDPSPRSRSESDRQARNRSMHHHVVDVLGATRALLVVSRKSPVPEQS